MSQKKSFEKSYFAVVTPDIEGPVKLTHIGR